MSRDDSILYTGVSSASNRAMVAKREDDQRLKERKRRELSPVGKLISELIEREKKEVCDISNFVMGTETPEESVKADLLARKMNLAFINRLHGQINNLLREQKGGKNE